MQGGREVLAADKEDGCAGRERGVGGQEGRFPRREVLADKEDGRTVVQAGREVLADKEDGCAGRERGVGGQEGLFPRREVLADKEDGRTVVQAGREVLADKEDGCAGREGGRCWRTRRTLPQVSVFVVSS